ncbi:pupal cuticle protein C1B-like [Nymphalis io]|uniref:pupal cuticle protein C1B-like n=1 Tax=Inachis io TaxID=171585 RepID=UPI00216792DC|nr:pupal cuticle protein C1B-like [Nymphalis io]
MMLKLLLLVCVAVAVQAGWLIAPATYYGSYAYGGWNPFSSYLAQPAIATQHSNILRSPFNLGQVSTYSKAVDTPFSSVRKADVRISNPGIAIAPTYHGIASPLVSHVGAPLPVPRVATGLLGVAFSAAPAVSHMTYTYGLGLAYGW